MPPTRTHLRSRKPPPDGFSDIEDTLLEFSNKMKDAENASHEGKKKYETVWPIFQITHQRSRYIYDLYYEKEAISKTLYEWLLKNGYADGMLIAKWKKQGYEKVCLLQHGPRSTFGPSGVLWGFEDMANLRYSCVASAVSKPKRLTSPRPVSAVCRANN
jgi:bud site selection protein 31